MKIAVCAPTYGRPDDFVHPTNVDAIAYELGGMPAFVGGTSPHDRSRGMIQARAMKTDAEAFFWIDDDIRATQEQCLSLVDSFIMRSSLTKTMTGIYVCRHLALRGLVALNVNFLPPNEGEINVEFGPSGGVHPVTSHGFGFCIVSRKCLEEMEAPRCEYEPGVPAKAWWIPEVVEGFHLGEDRSFTWRVNTQFNPKFYTMLADTRVCVEHAGWEVT